MTCTTTTRQDLLLERFRAVRARTLALAAPLSPEDCIAQSMPFASPIKWNLGHTSWFFEALILSEVVPNYRPFHPRFGFLFNSYYESVGDRTPRDERGLLTRPPLEEVLAYRRHVEAAIDELFERSPEDVPLDLFELGIHHEEQHQELLLTDVKHLFSRSPLAPAYSRSARATERTRVGDVPAHSFLPYDGGLVQIGTDASFSFDNETPAHRVFVEPYELGSRPITSGEYLAFLRSGGYDDAQWWLSDGWDWVKRERIEAPLYWQRKGEGWLQFTLAGLRPVDEAEPVTHLSYYEADAYARFRGARLPTEAEWENAARDQEVAGNFLEEDRYHPAPIQGKDTRPSGLFGDTWEWTSSAYSAYPGFEPTPGTASEYNGKFMSGQMVLRGGSCVTPRDHARATYRNFFHPDTRWQFSGLRLARTIKGC